MDKTKTSLLWGKTIFTSSQCPNCGAEMYRGQCMECWYKDVSTPQTKNRKYRSVKRVISL